MAAHVTEKELETAKKLAARKDGVTRIQLAEKLGISTTRARAVLRKFKAKARPYGKGKENRALVYFTAK